LELAQAILNGILIGGIFSLISVGLSLVFGVMDIVNFSQAEFLMVGMFLGFIIWQYFGIDPILSAILVGIVVFFIGVLMQRFLIERIIHHPPISQVFLTVGVSIVLKNIMAVIFGNEFHSVKSTYQIVNLQVGPLNISVSYLFAFCYALVAAIALYFFLEHTEIGRAMRATSQNRTAAVLMGINPKKIYMIAFGIGVGLAGLAGAAILPYTIVYPTVGNQYGLIMFTVVVLGGLSSIWGVMIAGLVIGIIQSVSSFLMPTELSNLVVFVVFILALILVRGGVLKNVLRTA
jgi:branched-chain amino acid transport system permease protein